MSTIQDKKLKLQDKKRQKSYNFDFLSHIFDLRFFLVFHGLALINIFIGE